MTHGSLFTGIGGFDLGFEWAGIKTIWQVEIDEYCRRLLELRFPGARRYADVRTIAAANGGHIRCDSGRPEQSLQGSRPHGETRVATPDIISGGFPCQPVSHAGKRQGAADDRYLWPEMFRVVQALRPRWVVAENVYGLITHEGGELLDKVYDDLEGEGYETLPPIVLPACAFGAPHRRDRVWIVAHVQQPGLERFGGNGADGNEPGWVYQNANRPACEGGLCRPDVADRFQQQWNGRGNGAGWWEREPLEAIRDARERGREETWMSIPESGLGRVAHGIPRRVDRLRGLGNAIVPRIAYQIGRLIIEADAS